MESGGPTKGRESEFSWLILKYDSWLVALTLRRSSMSSWPPREKRQPSSWLTARARQWMLLAWPCTQSVKLLKEKNDSVQLIRANTGFRQCSGSVPYVFWPPGFGSRAVIYLYGICIRILPYKQKNWRKTFISSTVLWFQKGISIKLRKYFLLASWSSQTKRAGSGSESGAGFIRQRYESEDPDLDRTKMSRIRNTGYKVKTEFRYCYFS